MFAQHVAVRVRAVHARMLRHQVPEAGAGVLDGALDLVSALAAGLALLRGLAAAAGLGLGLAGAGSACGCWPIAWGSPGSATSPDGWPARVVVSLVRQLLRVGCCLVWVAPLVASCGGGSCLVGCDRVCG